MHVGWNHAAFAAASLLVALIAMLAELLVSRAHETALLARGARVAPGDPAYDRMRWAYPSVFLLMGLEGLLTRTVPRSAVIGGVALFAAGKALKYWAIATLGQRWTFKVIVLPGAPLVATGPYRFLRHPNYLAVCAELAGFALLCGASVSGPLCFVLFGYLLRQRIIAEERALGLP